jgi:5-methylphenazine-1-carboxylate 1-monooxygenase
MPTTVVIGAGIAGLSTALSLHAEGLPVAVYEAVREVRPLGVGINLQPHAVRELDALGLMGELLERGVTPTELVYCTKRGQEIWREPRGLAAGYPWPQVSIHRGHLQTLLLAAFLDRIGEEHLHLGRRLAHVDHSGTRPVAAFTDGSEVEADVLAAADGIHSAVRAQLHPGEGPPKWNGSLLWRGMAEAPALLDGRTLVWAGHPDQKFIAYPIRDLGDGRQAVNFIAELRRPRTDLAGGEDWNQPGNLADFLPSFQGWDFGWLDVAAVIEAADTTYLFPMVDRDPLPAWRHGRVTLVGDAAHPMYPIGSNGASQAILDARVLAACLGRTADVDAALDAYEAARRPATTRLVEANRGMGPELPMKLVEQRAPDGFSDIGDVITPDEILTVTDGYRQAAGMALADLRSSSSVVDTLGPISGP